MAVKLVEVWARAAGKPRCRIYSSSAERDRVSRTSGDHMAESYSGEAYCVKCKEKRSFDGHVEEKNGRRFAKGICPVCGTKVTRILGKA